MICRDVFLPKGAPGGLCLAVVADLHDTNVDEVLAALEKRKPTHVLAPGDMVHSADHTSEGLRLLRESARRYPTFCSLGNHEFKHGLDVRCEIRASGAILLDNEFGEYGGILIGGLTSGYEGKKQGRVKKTPLPRTDWLDEFCTTEGYKILLSHHPEYFDFLKNYDIDLILSGHAHGGQWRLFGLPVFAPGQGLFPRYTSGYYGDRMFVSRGLSNRTHIPRIGNPEELVFLVSEGDWREGFI